MCKVIFLVYIYPFLLYFFPLVKPRTASIQGIKNRSIKSGKWRIKNLAKRGSKNMHRNERIFCSVHIAFMAMHYIQGEDFREWYINDLVAAEHQILLSS